MKLFVVEHLNITGRV